MYSIMCAYYVCVCMYIGYNDVTIIPSGARHVSIMDDGTSGNEIFIGTYVCTCVYVVKYIFHVDNN